MECVAYLRVSTEKQAEEGNGLDSQKRDIDIYARKNELIITDWYIDDGYTGANTNRPQLQRLIGDCVSNKIKCIVAFKLDRLSRSMVDGIYLIEKIFQPHGVDFRCVHDSVNYDTPMEQAYTQMMAVFAQLDKNTMLLRMRGGMLERVKKGYWMGGGNTPTCYRYDKESGILVKLKEESEKAIQALDLYLMGYSDKKIADTLGYSKECTVKSILTSPVNIGMIPYKGEIYQGLHEPVFEKSKYEAGLRLRDSRKSMRSATKSNMLTGLCYCGICGCKMRYQKWGGAGHKIYCCSRDKGLNYLPNYDNTCNNSLEWASDIEKMVEEKILQISLNISSDEFSQKESKLQLLKKQYERERTKLKRLYKLYAEGNDDVISVISEQEKMVDRLKVDVQSEEKSQKIKPDREMFFEDIKKVADLWGKIDNSNKNKILKSIISKIVIVNGNVDIILKNF